jgi:hypothetical protein
MALATLIPVAHVVTVVRLRVALLVAQAAGGDGDGFWWHLFGKGWASDSYL